jgi:hypothetical protein
MTIRDIVREYLIAHGHDGLTTDDDWDSCGCGVEAEIERLKETNTRLNRRATKAEAIADKSIEQLRNEGQRNLGRMLANYAAEKYHRECAEKDAEIERLRAINQYLFEAVEIAGCLPEMLAGLNEALDVLEGKA